MPSPPARPRHQLPRGRGRGGESGGRFPAPGARGREQAPEREKGEGSPVEPRYLLYRGLARYGLSRGIPAGLAGPCTRLAGRLPSAHPARPRQTRPGSRRRRAVPARLCGSAMHQPVEARPTVARDNGGSCSRSSKRARVPGPCPPSLLFPTRRRTVQLDKHDPCPGEKEQAGSAAADTARLVSCLTWTLDRTLPPVCLRPCMERACLQRVDDSRMRPWLAPQGGKQGRRGEGGGGTWPWPLDKGLDKGLAGQGPGRGRRVQPWRPTKTSAPLEKEGLRGTVGGTVGGSYGGR